MRNIILSVVAIIAVILIALSFQNNTQTVSNSIIQSVKKEKKEPKKDIKIVYINKNGDQNNQSENKKNIIKEAKSNYFQEGKEDTYLPPEQQKLASMINSSEYVPADDRVYKSEDGEYEAKVYIPKPKTTKEAELLPPSVPRMINVFTPSGSVMPIVLTKRVKNHHIIVKFKDKDSGNVEYRKIDTDSNVNSDETQSTPPLPPTMK